MAEITKLLDDVGVQTLVSGIKSKLLTGGKIKSDLLPSYVDDVIEIKGFNETTGITTNVIDMDNEDFAYAVSPSKLTADMIAEGLIDAIRIYYDNERNLFWLDTLEQSSDGETEYQSVYLQWDAIENFPASSVLGTTFNPSLGTPNGQVTSAIKPTEGYVYTIGGNKLLAMADSFDSFETGKIYVDIVTNLSYRWGGTDLYELSSPDEIYIPTNDAVAGVNSNYAVGAIASGTKMSDLKGKTFSEILEKMLVKDAYNDPKYTHTYTVTQPTSPVVVGSSVVVPEVTMTWNNNITPVETSTITVTSKTVKVPGATSEVSWDSKPSTYDSTGTATFTVKYSHGAGKYTHKSTLGNIKEETVPAASNTPIVRYVKVSAPIYIAGIETTGRIGSKTANKRLAAIDETSWFGDYNNNEKEDGITLPAGSAGTVTIEIPFANSSIVIEQFGVTWGDALSKFSKTTTTKMINGISVPYVVYTNLADYGSTIRTRFKATLKV